MKSNRFYLACLRDTVGSNISFHRENGCGYTTDISQAHVYSLEKAQRAWDRGREFELPLCADRVDALAVFHVDSQYLPEEDDLRSDGGDYVAYKASSWDGNDVYFLSEDGSFDTDYSKTRVYTRPKQKEGVIWVPKQATDKIKRPTFQVWALNKRKMVQAAGLITPDHVKKHYRRATGTGKVRWNCPTCGRLSWQYNPYDFEGCRNMDCERFNIRL